MTATHTLIADALERAQRRHREEVQAANARLFAFECALERQCGAQPGHIFTKSRPESERLAACSVCGLSRHLAQDQANQPPREVTA